jgi:hypothetical protein
MVLSYKRDGNKPYYKLERSDKKNFSKDEHETISRLYVIEKVSLQRYTSELRAVN